MEPRIIEEERKLEKPKNPDFAKMSNKEIKAYLDGFREKIMFNFPSLGNYVALDDEDASRLMNFKEITDTELRDYVVGLREFTRRGRFYESSYWTGVKRKVLANLNKIEKIRFEVGGYFGGYDTFNLELSNVPGEYSMFHDRSSFFEKPPELIGSCTVQELLKMLESLEIRKWNREYDNSLILDGSHWSLDISFKDGAARTLHIDGSNDFPPNFDKLREFFSRFLPEEENK